MDRAFLWEQQGSLQRELGVIVRDGFHRNLADGQDLALIAALVDGLRVACAGMVGAGALVRARLGVVAAVPVVAEAVAEAVAAEAVVAVLAREASVVRVARGVARGVAPKGWKRGKR